ncbi:hypothetical protein OKA04_19800 [Luteolibacter flavescens]|uniref:PA14 domain-containing protein n=1 Tax=Luteolibacter flavescens TaxID=1859460 RepID=A0ABT3FTS9_9BACT|nr:hypothetical protein [Luteolibacter flavescens]MCW1886993.1 hypothetical protein [Luteolibacter flavescens]
MNDDLPIQYEPGKKQRRVGWGAFSISVLIHGIFLLLAVFYFISWIDKPNEPVPNFIPGGGGGGNKGETANKVKTRARAMATPTHRPVIASTGAATFSLPESSTQVMDVGMPSALSSAGEGGGGGGGKGGGLGTGVGTGTGPGSGPGVGKGFIDTTPFGSRDQVAGAMPGRFYDFKQTRDAKPVKDYDVANYDHFGSRIIKIQDSNYRATAFRKFFESPDTLYLTQIAIPLSDAGTAPQFFNVADKVKPSGWLIHYRGEVVCNRDITFRFVGTGDDYLGVFVKGRCRLVAAWPGVRSHVIGDWEPAEPIADSGPTPLAGGPVTKGDWIKIRKGEKVQLDIGIGECPGGKVGFVLMVEEKGVEYRTMANGQPILPLFTTETISEQTKERVKKDFSNWEFEWENVPVFPVSQESRMGGDLFR